MDVIFEIVEAIKNAAAADEEVRFLMSINCWSYTCPDFIFFVFQKRNQFTLETAVQSVKNTPILTLPSATTKIPQNVKATGALIGAIRNQIYTMIIREAQSWPPSAVAFHFHAFDSLI